MARWAQVSREVAEAHPLHGLGGWLRLPSCLMVIVVFGSPFLLAREWRPRGTPDALLLNLDLAVSLALTLATVVLWFRRWRHFRLAYLWVFVLGDSLLTLAAMAWAPGLRTSADPAEAMADFAVGLALLLPLALAMQHSRRFRATFENRLRAEEVPLTRRPAFHSPAPPPAPSY